MENATSKSSRLVGLCLTMCPTPEKIIRLRENLFHPLECKISSTGERSKFPDPQRLVKEYLRPAADQTISPLNVRPLPVLRRTIRYLFFQVSPGKDVSWKDYYEFMSDRLRAVIKDITIQDVFEEPALELLAPIARFYIYAHYKLCEQSHPEYDSYLNLQHLNHTLLNILNIFHKINYELHENNFNTNYESTPHIYNGLSTTNSRRPFGTRCSRNPCQYPNGDNSFCGDLCDQLNSMNLSDSNEEAEESNEMQVSLIDEMMALYLLVNLGNEETVQHALDLSPSQRNGTLISSVIRGCICWLNGNHFPLIRLVETLPPLLCCALHLHLNKIQRHALGILSVAHNNKITTYALEDLPGNLLCSPELLEKSCKHYGLNVTDGQIMFLKNDFNWEAALMKPNKEEWLDEKLSSYEVGELLLPSQ